MMTERKYSTNRTKYLVMLGTAFDTKGGVSSVVNVYRAHGLFERWPIVYLPTHCDGGVARKILRAARSLFTYTLLILGGQVAIVHVHTASGTSFWRKSIFILLAYAVRRPVIFHLHGGNFDCFYAGMGSLKKRYTQFILDRASSIIVLSSYWRSWVNNVTINRNINCLYNPVTILSNTGETRQPTHLLFLGRMCRDKGIFDLLDVVAKMQARYPDLRLVCAGDGEVSEVAKRARLLAIEKSVQILGWITGDTKNKLLASAGILVLPSYFEGLPMSVLEAMAAGIPVVTTRVGGIPDAIDEDVDGYLIEPGDKLALESALEQLLGNKARQNSMGTAAQKKITDKFSADVVIPQLERIYANMGVKPVTFASCENTRVACG